jgi:hypothetical protein
VVGSDSIRKIAAKVGASHDLSEASQLRGVDGGTNLVEAFARVLACRSVWRCDPRSCRAVKRPKMKYMGSWAELEIGGVLFDTWKVTDGGIDPSIMVLFSESDKRYKQYPISLEAEKVLEEGEDWPFYQVQYFTTVQTLKKRLDFFGFTLDVCKRAFEIAKVQEIDNLRRSIKETDRLNLPEDSRKKRTLELLSITDADAWIEALREAFRSPRDGLADEIRTLADYFQPLVHFVWNRFPASLDPRFRLRFELEAALGDDVMLDVSEFVNNEYYTISVPMTKVAFDNLPAYERERCRHIVLTEGSTDKFYLETGFKLFHPELNDYVSFLDFSGWNIPGGASFLESMVRSFVAAGIRDRIVAVFDNDTAGFASHGRLGKLTLPSNVRVIRYPDINLARSYPTLGPSGTVMMDVNGLAASIELYLGEDVIRDQAGSFIPIQWKSFDQSLKRYQGEIIDKRGCWRRFNEKLERAGNNLRNHDGPEWRDLLLVTDAIRTAFIVADAEELIELAESAV